MRTERFTRVLSNEARELDSRPWRRWVRYCRIRATPTGAPHGFPPDAPTAVRRCAARRRRHGRRAEQASHDHHGHHGPEERGRRLAVARRVEGRLHCEWLGAPQRESVHGSREAGYRKGRQARDTVAHLDRSRRRGHAAPDHLQRTRRERPAMVARRTLARLRVVARYRYGRQDADLGPADGWWRSVSADHVEGERGGLRVVEGRLAHRVPRGGHLAEDRRSKDRSPG